MVNHAISKFLATPEMMRRKATKTDMESCAEQAAFVCGVGEKALSECPLDQSRFDEQFYQAFAKADMALMLEIQTALNMKEAGFTPRSLQVLSKMQLSSA